MQVGLNNISFAQNNSKKQKTKTVYYGGFKKNNTQISFSGKTKGFQFLWEKITSIFPKKVEPEHVKIYGDENGRLYVKPSEFLPQMIEALKETDLYKMLKSTKSS